MCLLKDGHQWYVVTEVNNCFSIYQTSELIASDKKKKGILSAQNSAGKVITLAHLHCVLHISRYPVNIPSFSSKSEHAKIGIHWFNIY